MEPGLVRAGVTALELRLAAPRGGRHRERKRYRDSDEPRRPHRALCTRAAGGPPSFAAGSRDGRRIVVVAVNGVRNDALDAMGHDLDGLLCRHLRSSWNPSRTSVDSPGGMHAISTATSLRRWPWRPSGSRLSRPALLRPGEAASPSRPTSIRLRTRGVQCSPPGPTAAARSRSRIRRRERATTSRRGRRTGKLIVFSRCPTGALCHTYSMKPDGSAITPIGRVCPAGATETSCADENGATLSPDGKLVALTASTGIVKTDPGGEGWIERSALTVMNLDGSGRRVVYHLSRNRGDLNGPAFSPNGKQLVFEHVSSGFTSRPGAHAVFVVNLDGSGLKQLTPWSENSGDNPDWSPDGKWILFHSHVNDPLEQGQYFVIRPDGSGRKQVTKLPVSTHLASASFAPDSKSIVISKGPEGGNIDVWTISLDGTGLTRVTKSARWESAPDWGKG